MAAVHVPDRLTVLAWHNVESTWCFPAAAGAGPRGFERQLGLLRRACKVVPLATALDDLAAGRRIGPRAVALTFDDGYRDHLELAAPALQRLGLPATFFLVPGLLSREVRAWWEIASWAFTRARRPELHWEGGRFPLTSPELRRTAADEVLELLKPRDRVAREAAVADLVEALDPAGSPEDRELFLDWDGAADLVRRGFDVGSHSMYHAILSQEEPGEQQRDLAESRRRLQDGLGVPAPILAYPNGTSRDYDAATIAAAQAAGHSHAVTMRTAMAAAAAPPYEVPRIGLTPLTGPRELWWWLRDALVSRRWTHRAGGVQHAGS